MRYNGQLQNIPTKVLETSGNIRDDTIEDPEGALLFESIQMNGILVPLIVSKNGEKYKIVAGHRRYTCAQILEIKNVPVVIVDVEDDSVAEIQFIENFHRKQMGKLEEAKVIYTLIEEKIKTQKEVSKMLCVSESFVSNRLSMLEWDLSLMLSYQKGEISYDVAREIHAEKDSKIREYILRHTLKSGANVQTINYWRKTMSAEKEIKTEELDPPETPHDAPSYKPRKGFCEICRHQKNFIDLKPIWVCPECLIIMEAEMLKE